MTEVVIFTCEACGETLTDLASGDLAVRNLERDFPGTKPEDCSVVCEPCYLLLTEPRKPTESQIERANAAVLANLREDGSPRYESAQGYACALSAIYAEDDRRADDETLIRELATDLAGRPCETEGVEDLESGCCGPCRARTALAMLSDRSSSEKFVAEAARRALERSEW